MRGKNNMKITDFTGKNFKQSNLNLMQELNRIMAKDYSKQLSKDHMILRAYNLHSDVSHAKHDTEVADAFVSCMETYTELFLKENKELSIDAFASSFKLRFEELEQETSLLKIKKAIKEMAQENLIKAPVILVKK